MGYFQHTLRYCWRWIGSPANAEITGVAYRGSQFRLPPSEYYCRGGGEDIVWRAEQRGSGYSSPIPAKQYLSDMYGEVRVYYSRYDFALKKCVSHGQVAQWDAHVRIYAKPGLKYGAYAPNVLMRGGPCPGWC